MGRKAKPIDLIVMGGKSVISKENIEARRNGEVRPHVDNVECPEWLCEIGQREWYRIKDELIELGFLTNIDTNQLAIYCDAYAKYIDAAQHINTNGLVIEHTNKYGATNIITNPYVRVATKYADLIKKYCAEFGLTPSSRASMAIPKKVVEVKEEPKKEVKNDRVRGLI